MEEKHSIWMSVSDLMTGLMVIFLFISIAYMIQANKYVEQLKDNQNFLIEYVENRNKLHDKLNSEFKDAPKEWQLVIGKDLSMKFENPEVLFASGKSDLTPQFKSILDSFLPLIFLFMTLSDIVLKKSELKDIPMTLHFQTGVTLSWIMHVCPKQEHLKY